MSTEPMLMMQTAAGEQNATTAALFQFMPLAADLRDLLLPDDPPAAAPSEGASGSISAVKKGDDVVTGGGIRGRVTKVSDDEAEVEIAQGVKVRVVKSTISQVLDPNDEASERLMLEFPKWKVWLVGVVIASAFCCRSRA